MKVQSAQCTFARMVPLSAKPSAAKVLDSKNSSRDPEGYHVIGLLNRRIWTIRWQNSLYFGLLLARSFCVWYHVIFSRSRDEIDQHVHDKAIISKSVTCKRHIRNSTGIFRVRLEFSTQIILPSTIFRTNFVESFALRLVRFESQKEKKNCTRTGKGKDSGYSQLSLDLEIGSALSP